MALPRFVQDFKQDFNQFLRTDLEPFAFVRFHDGEHHVIEQLDYRAQSGWVADGNPTWICFPLRESLEYVDPGYYYGISSPCDYSRGAKFYQEQLKESRVPLARMTFSSVFANTNYASVPLLEKRFADAVLVGPTRKCDIVVPEDGINKTWDVDGAVAKMREVEGRAILLAAGPCSNVLIHRYWMSQPPEKRVIVIDIGSAFDKKIHGKLTRPYQANPQTSHRCDWKGWTPYSEISQDRRDLATRRAKSARLAKRLKAEGVQERMGMDISRVQHPMVIDVRKPGPRNNPNVQDVKKRTT